MEVRAICITHKCCYHKRLKDLNREVETKLKYFCVAYTKHVATLQHDRSDLLVHESRVPVTWSCKPFMYALRTYFFLYGRPGAGTRIPYFQFVAI